MKKNNGQSMIGVIELADADILLDRHGRMALEDFQQVFSRRLQTWLRPQDQLRQLEDQRISVVLRGISTRGELSLATAKLESLFREPHSQFGRLVQLGFRAGFTCSDTELCDGEEAQRQANMALREARANASNYHVYTPQKENRADCERRMLEGLERALLQGELQLYYQPKVNTLYRSLAGAEALMRWRTPEYNSVSPSEFIAVAEGNEIIRPMTWWALKSAVARLARWPQDLSIAVNIPPPLLLDDQILSVIEDALTIHDVQPQRLVLEVTERIMVGNPQVMMRQLAALRAIGVQVSLDDFGTGYSSLSYFRDLPVDEIKIDSSFVRNMLDCEKHHAIVKAVIDLAHNFSLRVVAEGVETETIADRLKELGCDMIQGYFFDRPMPAEAFESCYGIRQPVAARRGAAREHTVM